MWKCTWITVVGGGPGCGVCGTGIGSVTGVCGTQEDPGAHRAAGPRPIGVRGTRVGAPGVAGGGPFGPGPGSEVA